MYSEKCLCASECLYLLICHLFIVIIILICTLSYFVKENTSLSGHIVKLTKKLVFTKR